MMQRWVRQVGQVSEGGREQMQVGERQQDNDSYTGVLQNSQRSVTKTKSMHIIYLYFA